MHPFLFLYLLDNRVYLLDNRVYLLDYRACFVGLSFHRLTSQACLSLLSLILKIMGMTFL